MAYGESALTTPWMPQIRFPNGENVNLITIKKAIEDEAAENGVPVAFRDDQLKTGGLFKKQIEDVLIMYHPDHANDYLTFLIKCNHMGKYAFMEVYNLGGSKNYGKLNRAGTDSMMGLVNTVGNAIGGTKAKVQMEDNYYTMLKDVLNNCVG